MYSIVRKILLDACKIDAPPGRRAKVLTVAGDNSRSVVYDGKFYSPLIDTIEDDLAAYGVRCLSVARIISTIKDERSYGQVYAPDGAFARALLQKRLLALFARGRYPYSALEESVWGRILDATGAQKVVAIQPSRELCVACRKRDVWVADVQHGVIAELHPWYGERFRASDPQEHLPHAFLCWDHGSRRVISKWAHARGVATNVVGNYWLARFRRSAPSDRLVQELSAQFARSLVRGGPDKAILFSLSWAEDDIPNGIMPDAVLEVIRSTANSIRWLIRLHPNQIRGFATHEQKRFLKFFAANLAGYAQWEPATHTALPVVLKNVHLHISWTSSACIDAAHLGVKSALLNPHFRSSGLYGEYYSYHREIGMVDLVEATVPALLAWIERNLGSKTPHAVIENGDAEYRRLIDFLAGDAAGEAADASREVLRRAP